jgi:putative redox protein
MELILMGTAGYTAMDVISIMRKKRQEMTDCPVRIHGPRAPTHPMVFTSNTIEHVVSGHPRSEEAVARVIELSVTKYCGAHAMLSRTATITTTHRIFEVATA